MTPGVLAQLEQLPPGTPLAVTIAVQRALERGADLCMPSEDMNWEWEWALFVPTSDTASHSELDAIPGLDRWNAYEDESHVVVGHFYVPAFGVAP